MAETHSHIVHDQIDHLFRHEYGKLVAVLTKTFGTSNIDLAEDVVQEAMAEALKQWRFSGVPKNPVGWIYKVSKFKAVNILNREKYKREYATEVAHHLQSEWTREPTLKHIFTDKEIADDQLRMIFTCCHPSISRDSQIALTLKTLCGFGINEIANAFLTSEENINKRLVRARKTIKDAQIPFEVPLGKELNTRLSSVLETLYLLFNEGYNASSNESYIRQGLCSEAIRLAELIAQNPSIKSSNTYALLALMTLNASRFDSRVEGLDNPIDLEHQDRTQWNQALIKKGLTYLGFTAERKEVSIYHILATISAHHCTAITYESTDWESILDLYDMLLELDASPLVLLNKAIVLSKTSGPKKAIQLLRRIEGDASLSSYLPYYTASAELYFQNGQNKKAIEILKKAMKLPSSESYNHLISNKISTYSEKN